MKIEKDNIYFQPNRIYWTRIIFSSDDLMKKTVVFAAASDDYLKEYYQVKDDNVLKPEFLDDWMKRVLAKWTDLGDSIFKNFIHYDTYENVDEVHCEPVSNTGAAIDPAMA